ncbi:unnamed protein product [Mytilus coruscus]|uniref:Endonuclease/exonuclease/phosphatase domain-containing protein n=1 Tax=Mytilus coruscus TaxID=42192 RepID=A0A6J8BBM0_MYTCO|nr:unnamed protein product [Mytilus coruscus]
MGSNSVNVDGYCWYGHNRRNIHIRAKNGSGGVGLLVRNDFDQQFHIEIVDDNTDGIMWVQFKDKRCNANMFYVCVVYLPPENSTRAVNVHEFMETLMTHIYTNPQGNLFYPCGDFNSRCSDFSDSIEGIYCLPERDIVDFQTNGYGNIFCDFLIVVNCCILNGRKTLTNDFTFVSTRGSSVTVVDYCILPYEMLDSFNSSSVTRAITIIQSLGEPGRYDLHKIVPDHSLLTWNMCLYFPTEDQVSKNKDKNQTVMKIKYDTKSVPEDWLNGESVVTEINRVILQLEQSEASQQNIDKMYENFVSVLKTEMSEKLQSKEIRISNAINNKARKCKKPWWNSELTMLWNGVCKAEKNWNKCRLSSKKRELRHIFIQKRKLFDRGVQGSKRQYWHSMQEELINLQGNPKEFWRKTGRIGVGSERQNTIPMEIKLNDGSICDDKDIIINKWKCDFEEMLNKNSDTSISNEIENCNSDIICDEILDGEITSSEIYDIHIVFGFYQLMVIIKYQNG